MTIEQPVCERGGACCRAGGPGLHGEDLDLVARGVLLFRHLVTLRKGERVADQVAGRVIVLEEEMVKIRGRAGGDACILYDEWGRACRLHPDRPAECRALFCRDDRAITAMYQEGRVTRRDLLGGLPELLRLAREHEARCSWEKIGLLVAEWERDSRVEGAVRDLVILDEAFRDRLSRDFGADPRETWFLLGRPLADGLPGLGITVHTGPAGIRLFRPPTGPTPAGPDRPS